MSIELDTMNQPDWQQQAQQLLIQGHYQQAASLYEKAIELEPGIKSHYWHLGLLLLLQEQEEAAQTAWMMGMMEAEPEQLDAWTQELAQVVLAEAQRRENLTDYPTSWLLRQHSKEIVPDDANNRIILLLLAIELKRYNPEELDELIQVLSALQPDEVNADLLMELLHKVLDLSIAAPNITQFAEACLPFAPSSQLFIDIVLQRAVDIGFVASRPDLAAELAELCLRISPEDLEVLGYLASFYNNHADFMKAIAVSRLRYSLSHSLEDQIFSNQLILQSLVGATGRWEEAFEVLQRHEALLLSLTDADLNLTPISTLRLSTASFFFPYFRDDLKANRAIHNLTLKIFQDSMQQVCQEQTDRFRRGHPGNCSTERKLRIGYLSHCLGRHSVGWLSRSLFDHHDHEQFDIYGYFVNYREGDPLQEWYTSKVSKFHKTESTELETIKQLADRIYDDEVDILIDLDSLTLDISCQVMALKPAPVQATWLGWDASGIPAIDYFIADPYVLPDWADAHYREKIWRLPQTYIGLDGFEVAIPKLRRSDLDIPEDAIVYFCVQNSYKRHPEISRLQMQIIREVPNSYLLIKGIADAESLKNFFLQLATETGVSADCLRFIEGFPTEAMHRASLRLADVVLDTYPYNGATTTLETLWMEVPLVTRVGETFSSRNSYTMLMNVGVSEGIAWTDEAYVDWGIRFGTELALRQNVAWQLRQAKQTAPLWNGKQFTREMEHAYRQMWATYCQKP
jgi:predicted O-linked N-acetylglucosamine transferase (SPINDLY family)